MADQAQTVRTCQAESNALLQKQKRSKKTKTTGYRQKDVHILRLIAATTWQ